MHALKHSWKLWILWKWWLLCCTFFKQYTRVNTCINTRTNTPLWSHTVLIGATRFDCVQWTRMCGGNSVYETSVTWTTSRQLLRPFVIPINTRFHTLSIHLIMPFITPFIMHFITPYQCTRSTHLSMRPFIVFSNTTFNNSLIRPRTRPLALP